MLKKVFSKENLPWVAGGGVSLLAIGLTSYFYFRKPKSTKQSPTFSKGITDPHYDNRVELTEIQAQNRAKWIYNTNYEVTLAMSKGHDVYAGSTIITFNVNQDTSSHKCPDQLFIDFTGRVLTNCLINNTPIHPSKFIDHKIHIDSKTLYRGDLKLNKIEVEFQNSFIHNGQGPHRFTDPQDGEDYIWTQFQSFFCHLLFPCFNQPSLKARLKLTVIAPEDWKVIANELNSSPPFMFAGQQAIEVMEEKYRVPASVCNFAIRTQGKQDNYVHIFKQTPKISPYLYGVMAGPYQETVNRLPGSQNYVPMRVFIRKSLAKYFEPNQYFHPVMCGISFYQKFFGHKFPFSKYDQIIVPEFNWGAMENVGAVTFTESYISRSPPTQSKRQHISNVILHQLAHMWFGNLVTMFWWKDLWLNESFATFTSYLCQQLAGDALFNNDISKVDHHDPWLPFINLKAWAYRTDTVSSTHPVAGEVKDTEESENIFDGITYAKGSSFLKQFYHYITGEVFSAGLHIYFNRFEYGNTEFDDFLQAMQEAYDAHHKDDQGPGLNIFTWAQTWLRHTGTNSFEYRMEVSNIDKKITKFELVQGFKQYGEKQYREQTIDISLYDSNCHQTVLKDIRVKAQQVTDVTSAIGHYQPAAILINSNDWGYALPLYDQRSVRFWQEGNLKKVDSPVNRRLIWLNLFQYVKDGKMSAIKLIQIFEKNILYEDNQSIISSCFMYLHAQFGFLPFRVRDQYYTRIWNLLRQHIIPKWVHDKSPQGANVMQTLLNSLVEFTSTQNEIQVAKNWLEKSEKIFQDQEDQEDKKQETLAFNQAQRRDLIRIIWGSTRISRADKQKLLDDELNGEQSDNAELLQIFCEARQPDAGIKSEVWKRACDKGDKRSLYVRRASMQGFQSWRQADLLAVYCNKFFDEVLQIFEKCDRKIAEGFYFNLNPANYLSDKKTTQQLKDLLGRVPQSQKYLRKLVSDSIERLEVRKVAIELVESEIE